MMEKKLTPKLELFLLSAPTLDNFDVAHLEVMIVNAKL
jgi:hypothetical protein